MYLNTLNRNECCGCTACCLICHPKAIKMEADAEGFWYPIKDMSLCTNCGLCEKVCPVETPLYDNNSNPDVYACYLNDVPLRKLSTSGGAFYSIAKYVISKGGIVYGAALSNNLSVIHQSAESLDELASLRGSKYVQSNLLSVYAEIRKVLKEGRLVYFTGTPCQVAGLKSFLIKPYAKLITSDLVCHGVPSQKMFDFHLKWLSRSGMKVKDYKFRNTSTGGVCETVVYIDSKGYERVQESPTYELSPFLYSFMYAYNYRYICYNCPFAKIPRQGDITLGDFWGVNNFFSDVDASKGCSLVLVNSVNGFNIWNLIKQDFFYKKSNLSQASAYNGNLLHSTPMNPMRDGIYDRIENEGYEKLATTLFRSPRHRKIRFRLFVKKILGKKLLYLIKYLLRNK